MTTFEALLRTASIVIAYDLRNEHHTTMPTPLAVQLRVDECAQLIGANASESREVAETISRAYACHAANLASVEA